MKLTNFKLTLPFLRISFEFMLYSPYGYFLAFFTWIIMDNTDFIKAMQSLTEDQRRPITQALIRQEFDRAGAELKSFRAEEAARTDPLTGLNNRMGAKELYSLLTSSVARDNRNGTIPKKKMWMILLDVDNFKSVNDAYGHDVGDKVLQHVSHLLTTRKSDVAARWGGEELIVFFAGSSEEGALEYCERLCAKLAQTPYDDGKNSFAVTASFGITGFRPEEESLTIEEAAKRADIGMYEAKKTGKNRVVYVPDAETAAALAKKHEELKKEKPAQSTGSGKPKSGKAARARLAVRSAAFQQNPDGRGELPAGTRGFRKPNRRRTPGLL